MFPVAHSNLPDGHSESPSACCIAAWSLGMCDAKGQPQGICTNSWVEACICTRATRNWGLINVDGISEEQSDR